MCAPSSAPTLLGPPAALLVAAVILAVPWHAVEAQQRNWAPLGKDGLHDPVNPALPLLQEPAQALALLPADGAGNQVRWVEALEDGYVSPRTNLLPETKVRVLDTEILMNLKGSAPIVRFPHRAHTLWLDCSNCHEQLFKSKRGANRLSMERMLQGEQCGLCHGAVAFPLTECSRCHSVARTPAGARPGG